MTTAYSGIGDPRRSLELLWHRKDPGGRGPKPSLDLERIVSAAVELADREGLGALSMRRVAAEIGAGTMSLYRHVPGKGELLDLMLDHVIGPPESHAELRGKDWRSVLTLTARSTWRLYLAHPWLLQVNQARPILGPNALGAFDLTLASMEDLGLTGREKVAMILAVDHYVTGAARTYILQQEVCQQSDISDEDFWAAQEPVLTEAMGSGAYPQIAKLPEDAFSIGGEEALEFGLGPLLDGLEAMIDRRSQKSRKSRTPRGSRA
ncbi:TetR/AcrR family transcriptional regulator [Actinopolymorpha sp. B17G11]|uniref:TetR/AcrR family transcriptional regulator n=1 Tax=Actinopolymorpha sp. B17G11 TaxID=3160861 RepID=UPI0032E43125